MFSKTEPPAIRQRIFFCPELKNVSVFPLCLKLRKGERSDLFTLQFQTAFPLLGLWIWVSHADGVMGEIPPFLSLEEVPSKWVYPAFSCLVGLALKLATFLIRKSLSLQLNQDVSLLFSFISHSSSTERKTQALSFSLYEPIPFFLEYLITTDF